MRTALRRDLTAAIKARDHITVAALRSALAAIENAEAVDAAGPGAVEVQRRVVSAGEADDLLRAEIQERRFAARSFERVGRPDEAHRLCAEAEVLAAYLLSS